MGTDLEAAIIRHELMTVLFRLARENRNTVLSGKTTRQSEIHALFTKELEISYMRRQSILDYATRLGFSERTLSRACITTTGRTAKRELDERIALEAKRLLVHQKTSIAEIGHQLGFTEATNFLKFFKRIVGCTPLEFRHAHSSDGLGA